jgi:hypothetical protein
MIHALPTTIGFRCRAESSVRETMAAAVVTLAAAGVVVVDSPSPATQPP